MALDQDALDEIRTIVRGGFEERDRIVEILCEELYEPGELDEEEVEIAVDFEIAKLEAEKLTWPETTDCDRLDAVFSVLESQGVISLQNAGNTQSDGCSDCFEVYADSEDKDSIIGYCFFHRQDLERAVNGDGLYLSYGPMPVEDDEEVKGPPIGRLIVKELEAAGFGVRWNGSYGTRIEIPQMEWKKR